MFGGNSNIGCPHFCKILMKRLTNILIIVFLLIIIAGCEDANVTKLKNEINAANSSCPISMGISGDLISIKYYEKNNSVLLYYSLNEDIAGAVFLKKNKDSMMKQFRLLLSNKESMKLVKDMVNAKASLMIIYKTPSTGKTVKFSVPFEELKEIVKDYTPEKVAEICHIDADDLRKAAIMYAKADRAPIIYCLGVTEHSTGTEGVMSMSNMAMMVGKLGREGCGVNPLRGQNNVQGACDMGAQPNVYPGYQKVTDPAVREKFEKAWGVKLDPNIGTHATDVFPKAITGEIKGLYIYGEDPVVTDPDTTHIIKALKSLDFFVLQELFMTETAQYADVILPGVSYAEKEGTFTNTERRVQRVRKAVTVPGEMRLDTDIIIDLMNRMGYPQPYLTSAQIMDEIASLTPSFAGISHERLDSEEVHGQGLQWPCTSKDHPGTPIMHVGKFSRGLGWFYPAKYVPSAELPDEEYPIILMTGRILYHYTTRAMTGKTPELMEIEGKSFIEMNIVDADKLGIKNGDKVRVSSRRGSIESTARVGTKTSPGESWMPFHFPDGNANWLTNAALDKYARIPEYKVCAIKIEKA